MEHRVSDVVAVLDDLDIGSAHFFGYSMGGGIGFRFAKFAAERARSLIIGGASASGHDPNAPHPVLGLLEPVRKRWLLRLNSPGLFPSN